MIALWVFSVWILWVLTLITSTIATSDQVNLKTTATMLAKENMEILFHKRNSNRISYQIRDCLIDWNDWKACEISLTDLTDNSNSIKTNSSPQKIIIPTFDEKLWYKFYIKEKKKTFREQREDSRFSFFTWNILEWNKIQKYIQWYKYCPVETDTSVWKNNTTCWKKSFFWSFLEINKIKSIPRPDLLSWNIYKITSKTLYIKWATTWEITLESFIANLDKE